MNDKAIIVGIINTSTTQDIIKFLNYSKKNDIERFYSLGEAEKKPDSAEMETEYPLAFVVYESNNIKRLYLGNGRFKNDTIKDGRTYCSIYYKIEVIKNYSDSPQFVKNFISCSELNTKEDFSRNAHVNLETSKELVTMIKNMIHGQYSIQLKPQSEQNYPHLISEDGLLKYSQKNEFCKRSWDVSENKGERGEFQRDYERIIHARAFKRLVDKAQIFTASKGDHYRTRMTHTLEVAQIARGIALELKLNISLTEAIALAHDLGHTPFGHQGERTLKNILESPKDGENNIIYKGIESKHNFFGGFKHNFQSLRVANYLEEKYVDFEGLDLSYQTLEGMLKHTKFGDCKALEGCKDCKKDNPNCNADFCIREFLPNGYLESLYLQYPNATTLEGQIVAIADEIAQRSHDLDDAFSAHLISPEDVLSYLSLSKADSLRKEIEEISGMLEDMIQKNRMFVDESELRCSRIVSSIITYFMADVVAQSHKNIENLCAEEYKEIPHDIDGHELSEYRFKKKIINFSSNGEFLCNYLEKIISKKVINSTGVAQFDDHASRVVRGLFYAYYKNPKLLHEGTLRRIFIDTRKYCENAIDMQNSDIDVVRDEISMITGIGKCDLLQEKTEEYQCKRKILVRGIVDFISGMTDSYAINEYTKLLH